MRAVTRPGTGNRRSRRRVTNGRICTTGASIENLASYRPQPLFDDLAPPRAICRETQWAAARIDNQPQCRPGDGDAVLAGDPKRWLPAGLFTFLLGHILLIFLFQETRDPSLEMTPLQLTGAVGLGAASVAMLAWLWRALGPMRAAVTLYVIVIAVMVGSSFLLPGFYWPAMVGAVLFMISDAILATGLFRELALFGSERLSRWAVWFLYYGGQAMIAWAFLRLP